jgi:hypothetical protein
MVGLIPALKKQKSTPQLQKPTNALDANSLLKPKNMSSSVLIPVQTRGVMNSFSQ